MRLEAIKEELISGVISLVIGLAATYAVSIAIPTPDLKWALTAVGFATFFSGFFSAYYTAE